MDNTGEGFGRGSKHEFVHTLTTAKGEAEELKSQLYSGPDIHYPSEVHFHERYAEADLLVKKTGFYQLSQPFKHQGQKFKERS